MSRDNREHPYPQLHFTRDYKLFVLINENREIKPEEHAKLRLSMEDQGFLPYWPIIVIQLPNGKFGIKFGQHRHHFAEILNTGIWYMIATHDIDIAKIEDTVRLWTAEDYAARWAASGKEDYQTILSFVRVNDLPLTLTFATYTGHTSFMTVRSDFREGRYRITDKKFGDKVFTVFDGIRKNHPRLGGRRLYEACIAACVVPEFDTARMIRNSSRYADKMKRSVTRDAYLTCMEETYNYGRKASQQLRLCARVAELMRSRNEKEEEEDAA